MDVALLIARLVLAAVFGVAGLAKLADQPGARTALAGFGLPDVLAVPGAVVLPIVELVVAGALLPSASAAWGGAAAFALLAAFSAAIAVAMARGRAPECHCFGQLHSEPAGLRALARNLALVGVAVYVAIAGRAGAGPGAVAWIGRFGLAGAALVVAVCSALALGWLALALLRRHGRLLLRIDRLEAALAQAGIELEESAPVFVEGLQLGSPAPDFALAATDGSSVSLTGLLDGRPLLLAFVSAGCGPCHALLPQLARWETGLADELTVVTLGSGDAEMLRAQAQEHGLRRLLVDVDGRIQEAYGVGGTPGALLVASDGTVASRVAMGEGAVAALAEGATAGEEEEAGLAVGSPVPDLRRPLLDGETVALTSLIERDTIVLFWNPSCGFCRAMHDDLLRLEAASVEERPALVVVSSGDQEATRADGFLSPVLLDESFEVAQAFGAGGTPMAVLVAADGTVASPLAAGADAVLELARERPSATLRGPR
ncbi:MAG: MauE/DoxX family redox-associated membrane protein [Gaiellaceae bacterium]